MFIPLEYLILIFAILFLGTQILVPALRGKPMFPMFRKKSWEEHQLESASEKAKKAKKLLEAAELEAKAAEMEIKANEVKDKAFWDKLKN